MGGEVKVHVIKIYAYHRNPDLFVWSIHLGQLAHIDSSYIYGSVRTAILDLFDYLFSKK